MAGMWPADMSKSDISLAVCQDKFNNKDDEATEGKEGAVRIHLILKAHTWQVILPPPSSPTSMPVMLLGGAWLVTAKFSFSLLAPQRGDTGLSLKPCTCCAPLEATEGTRVSLESGLEAITGNHQQHLKCPCGQSQSALCRSLWRLRGDFGYLTSMAISLDLLPNQQRWIPGHSRLDQECLPDPNLGQSDSPSQEL